MSTEPVEIGWSSQVPMAEQADITPSGRGEQSQEPAAQHSQTSASNHLPAATPGDPDFEPTSLSAEPQSASFSRAGGSSSARTPPDSPIRRGHSSGETPKASEQRGHNPLLDTPEKGATRGSEEPSPSGFSLPGAIADEGAQATANSLAENVTRVASTGSRSSEGEALGTGGGKAGITGDGCGQSNEDGRGEYETSKEGNNTHVDMVRDFNAETPRRPKGSGGMLEPDDLSRQDTDTHLNGDVKVNGSLGAPHELIPESTEPSLPWKAPLPAPHTNGNSHHAAANGDGIDRALEQDIHAHTPRQLHEAENGASAEEHWDLASSKPKSKDVSNGSSVIKSNPTKSPRAKPKAGLMNKLKHANQHLKQESRRVVTISEHFRKLAITPSAPLQRRFVVMKENVAIDKSISSIFHTPKPLSVLLQWNSFQFLMLVMAGFYLSSFVIALTAVANWDVCQHTDYRIRLLDVQEPRSSSDLASWASDFTVQKDGCTREFEVLRTQANNNTMEITFASPFPMNGWSIQLENAPERASFVVEGRTAGAQAPKQDQMAADGWELCGASYWKPAQSAQAIRMRDSFARLPKDGQFEHDMRPAVGWIMNDMVSNVILAVMYFLVAGCGVMRRAFMGLWVIYVGFIAAGISFTAGAIHYGGSQHGDTLLLACDAFACFMVVWVVYTIQAVFLELLIAFGGLLVLARVFSDVFIWEWPELLYLEPPITGPVVLVLGILATSFKRYLVAQSWSLIRSDKYQYEKAWDKISEEQADSISTMKEVGKDLQTFVKEGPRQYNRKKKRRASMLQRGLGGLFGGGNERKERMDVDTSNEDEVGPSYGLPRKVDANNPVMSFDQLYAQAGAVRPLIQAKVQEWAEQTNGYFRCKRHDSTGSPVFLKWKDVNGTMQREHIFWPPLKDPQRAIEKVIQSYNSDPSKLIDICRFRIVFENAEDLTSCMEAVAMDRDVVLHSVKNRYAPNFDARRTAGFRDVVFGLRIVSEEAVRLCADTHVCELQMILHDYARLQNEENHQRYLTFRKAMSHWQASAFIPDFLKKATADVIEDTAGLARAMTQKGFKQVEKLTVFGRLGKWSRKVSEWSMRSGESPIATMGPDRSSSNSTNGSHSKSIGGSKRSWVKNEEIGDSNRSIASIKHSFKMKRQQSKENMKQAEDPKSTGIISTQADAPPGPVEPSAQPPTPETRRFRTSRSPNARSPNKLSPSRLGGNERTDRLLAEEFEEEVGASAASEASLDHSIDRVLSGGASSEAGIDIRPARQDKQANGDIARRSPPTLTVHHEAMAAGPENVLTSPINKSQASNNASNNLIASKAGVTQQLHEVMEKCFYKSVLFPAGKNDQSAKRWHEAMASASAASAFHTSAPLVTAVILRSTQVCLGVLAALYLAYFGFDTYALSGPDTCKYKIYGLQVKPGSDLDISQIFNFSLWSQGCELQIPGQNVSSTGNAIMMHLPEPVGMNGWSFITKQGFERFTSDVLLKGYDEDADLVGGKDCGLHKWNFGDESVVESILGSSWFAYYNDSSLQTIKHDLRPPWPAFLVLAVPAVRAFLCILMVMCAMIRRPELSPGLWLAMLSIVGVVYGTAAIGCQLRGGSITCLLWMLAAFGAFINAAISIALHRHLLPITVLFHSLVLVVHLLERDVAQNQFLFLAMLPEVIVILMGFMVLFLRQGVLTQSVKLIEVDRQGYDNIWAALLTVASAGQQLEELRRLIKSVRPLHAPRQYNRIARAESNVIAKIASDLMHQNQGARQKLKRFISGADEKQMVEKKEGSVSEDKLETFRQVDFDSPVSSLDQLFIQAAGVEPILRQKVQEYAQHSGAYFPAVIRGLKTFVCWGDVEANPTLMKSLKWTSLKRPTRAVEKLLRSYGGDTSKLVDICRSSLIFEEVTDLTRCMEAVINDPDVALLRTKNRLDLHYDSKMSAGYRDVAMNLRIITNDTIKMGVETHVCELQLILRPFAENKSEKGHKLYVQFRNARAE